KSASFQTIAALCALRAKLPALTSGATNILQPGGGAADPNNGVFAFARGGDGIDPVVVVINASDKERVIGTPAKPMKLVSADGKPLFARGDKLERIPVAGFETHAPTGAAIEVQWQNDLPRVELRIGP